MKEVWSLTFESIRSFQAEQDRLKENQQKEEEKKESEKTKVRSDRDRLDNC